MLRYLSIEQALNRLFEMIENEGDIIDFPWCDLLLCEYYKYFNDSNLSFKKGALLAFYGLLLDWDDESGQPFFNDKDTIYFDFNKYLSSFLDVTDTLKLEYPATYDSIMNLLEKLDKRENFLKEISYVNVELVMKIRSVYSIEQYKFNEKLYIELGVERNR